MSSHAGVGFIGSDPHRVEQLGAALLAGAELLDDVRSQLTSLLYHSTWEGRDSVEAREDWSSSSAPALGITAELLRTMSQVAYANARQQVETSLGDGSGVIGHGTGSGHGHQEGGHDGHDRGLFGLLGPLHILVDLGEIGIHVMREVPPWLKMGGKLLGPIGLGISALDFYDYFMKGDTGGAVLSAASFIVGGIGVGLTVAAAIASAPVSVPAIVLLSVAGVGLAFAAEFPSAREWVGDRWDDMMEFGGDVVEFSGGVINELATDAHAAWDATAEFTGNVVEGVVDGAQNLASGAVDFGKGVYDFVF
ncbi:hypothetical protein Rhe02_75140 [Rhizocola hellebori]|uniref:WXG100 family type VII secretion target n=1 Tax=Rhizocola hellebori TaxID=1392758 RepID=A0A8J3VKE2_9ACTN|nr:hypothetical protein [Rhizocola hellebori]GIH09447.1 hypothetical protein Rhe02_75140 [Rhizocola hellebori]